MSYTVIVINNYIILVKSNSIVSHKLSWLGGLALQRPEFKLLMEADFKLGNISITN